MPDELVAFVKNISEDQDSDQVVNETNDHSHEGQESNRREKRNTANQRRNEEGMRSRSPSRRGHPGSHAGERHPEPGKHGRHGGHKHMGPPGGHPHPGGDSFRPKHDHKGDSHHHEGGLSSEEEDEDPIQELVEAACEFVKQQDTCFNDLGKPSYKVAKMKLPDLFNISVLILIIVTQMPQDCSELSHVYQYCKKH